MKSPICWFVNVRLRRAYRSCKHDAAAIDVGTGTTWSWCCHRGWVVAVGVPGDHERSAVGTAVVVVGIAAVGEPVQRQCADAAAAVPAAVVAAVAVAADAEAGDGAPGRVAPLLVPVVVPIADTPSRSSSDYFTCSFNRSDGSAVPLPRPHPDRCPQRG